MSGKSGRRSPRSQREMFRKIHGCAMELLAKLGHSYVISALSREPLFSISEDREVVCKEGEQLLLTRVDLSGGPLPRTLLRGHEMTATRTT